MRKITFIFMLSVFSISLLSAQNSSVQPERRALSPDAQTQPIPADRQSVKGTAFTVNKSGEKAMVAIDLEVTCDTWWGEPSYNVWSYDQGAYLWASDHVFTSGNQTIVENLSLEEGDYSIDCFDSFGDGGIAGTVTNVPMNTVLVSWGDGDYGAFGFFDFTVVAPPMVPLSNWAFAIIGLLAVTFVFIKFRK